MWAEMGSANVPIERRAKWMSRLGRVVRAKLRMLGKLRGISWLLSGEITR
jgi:hypothetical protein